MKHKLGICIPYRNREDHLKALVPHLGQFLTEKGIDHKFYVCHQVDDKLLNRGTLKNIAAKYALDDGCDYIAWHDVDMLPHDNCDYSYPTKHPVHIATKLSKYNYGIGYDQYFGGIILFTKSQIKKTNGYSNGYWDWGQEDDDLFWRCYYEGYTTGKIFKKYENKSVANFNGNNSYVFLPVDGKIAESLETDHTISILVNPQQQIDKVPIWLIGDKDKQFIEYPILRKNGCWTWGISFNNSRAITMTLLGKENQLYYNWGKRFEGLWTWVTLSYSKKHRAVFFYINDDLTCQVDGIKQNKSFPIQYGLKKHDKRQLVLGYCDQTKTRYKGKIAEIKIYDRFFLDINDVFDNKENLILHYNFENGVKDEISGISDPPNRIEISKENVEVIENILPYRREGSVLCLSHPNEGFVNGSWVKEATARNEKRLVTEMQQGKINYKKDGMNSLKYEVVSTEMFMDNCLMINVKL